MRKGEYEMRKRYGAIIATIMLSLVLIIPITYVNVDHYSVEAASKKAFYYSALVGKKSNRDAYVKSVSLKGKKLIVKGSFLKAASESKFYDGKTKFQKYKKRTFKLSGNCKFYAAGGDTKPQRITKKQFLKIARIYNGLALLIRTNKSGKVYKVEVSS